MTESALSTPSPRPDLAAPWPVPTIANATADEAARVVDALLRFAAGQDLLDAALFRSAFTSDAVLDFVQPAGRLGATIGTFDGVDQIASTILPNLARLDTTHCVTNTRVWIDGACAKMFALVEAQHLPALDHRRQLLLKNIYWMSLRAESNGAWAIDHMLIRNVWMTGDPTVLFG